MVNHQGTGLTVEVRAQSGRQWAASVGPDLLQQAATKEDNWAVAAVEAVLELRADASEDLRLEIRKWLEAVPRWQEFTVASVRGRRSGLPKYPERPTRLDGGALGEGVESVLEALWQWSTGVGAARGSRQLALWNTSIRDNLHHELEQIVEEQKEQGQHQQRPGKNSSELVKIKLPVNRFEEWTLLSRTEGFTSLGAWLSAMIGTQLDLEVIDERRLNRTVFVGDAQAAVQVIREAIGILRAASKQSRRRGAGQAHDLPAGEEARNQEQTLRLARLLAAISM